MNKSTYNNKLRAAKRRIWDSLESEGFQTKGVKHSTIVSEFINRNDLHRPIEIRWQDYIIALYEADMLPDVTPKKRTQKEVTLDRKEAYKAYINSKEWKQFRKEALQHFGNRCGLCDAEEQLELHHKTYKNFTKETFADVIPLCRRCHKRHHNR